MTEDPPDRPLSETGPLSPGFEMRYGGLRGEQGAKGDTGEQGAKGDTGARGLTSRTARAIVSLFLLAFIIAGSNLLLTVHYVHSSQAAAQRQAQAQLQARQETRAVIEKKLCTTLGKLAALKPPPGNPATNPSRKYLQDLHATLDQISPDLGCR